jgi:leucyl/phenylalanyl-tRNA--protein transferase
MRDAMGVTWVIGDEFEFPPPENANEDGILAIGGQLNPVTLRRAYRQGIFPWPLERRLPVFWFCPPERCVLELDELRVSRSLAKLINRDELLVTFDKAFDQVMEGCAAPRDSEESTWIDERMTEAYTALHAQNGEPTDITQNVTAHSVEVWRDDALIGGLYGIAVGGVFSGESMFFREPNASKVALAGLVERMKRREFDFLDCQVHTPHLESMGAKMIPRALFLERLVRSVDRRLKGLAGMES